MKRNTRLSRAHVLPGIIFILVIILVFFIGFPFNKSAINEEKVIPGENITHIKVSTNTGDVQILPYDGDEIRVQLTGKTTGELSRKYKLKVKEKGSQVTIEAKKKSRLAQGFIISVKLPNKQYEQLEVEADVANIDVGKIDAFNHYLVTSVGNITVLDADGIVAAEVEVGNIDLQFKAIINDIIAKTEVGNIVVKTEEAPTALQTIIQTSVGHTNINLPNINNGSIGVDGAQVNLTAEVGDVSLVLVGE